MDTIIDEIIQRTEEGLDWLNNGAIDLAFEQLIEIKKLAEKLKGK